MAFAEPIENGGHELIFCATREEMLKEFEEYKERTKSGWRCIKSNADLGRWNMNIQHIHIIL